MGWRKVTEGCGTEMHPCGASSHKVFGSKRTKTRMALLAYGGGPRYVLSEADHMNFGMEVAFGGEDAAIHFRVGEAF